MTDITPTHTSNKLQAETGEGDILITDISRPLVSTKDKHQHSRWKRELRTELVREHTAATKKKGFPYKSLFRRLFRLD